MPFHKSRAIATLLCLTATTAWAGEPQKPESAQKKKTHASRIASVVEVQPVAPLSERDASQVSFAAGRVLKHVIQARGAIVEGKKDEAATQVEQGLKLLAIIDAAQPHVKVKTEIKSGNLAYTDEDELTPRYVTLYDELDRYDVISPVAQAKQESRQRQNPAAGDAAKTPAGAMAFSHVDIRHSSAKLDLVVAQQMLNRTRRSLSDGKLENADESLLALLTDGVLFELEEIDLPLEEAADNLKLAEIEMKQGRTAEAKAALHVAIDQLKRYEKLAGDTRSAEVKALHQEITKLTGVLEKGMPSEEEIQKMAAQIGEWWQNTTKWFKTHTK